MILEALSDVYSIIIYLKKEEVLFNQLGGKGENAPFYFLK
jgi:hypothetical protein